MTALFDQNIFISSLKNLDDLFLVVETKCYVKTFFNLFHPVLLSSSLPKTPFHHYTFSFITAHFVHHMHVKTCPEQAPSDKANFSEHLTHEEKQLEIDKDQKK